MKKVLKSKKGFTLVELLAVIVVLAIIMVIATQTIGTVIKKNTVDSFKSSLDVVAKQAKQADVLYEFTSDADATTKIASLVDYDVNQYTISVSGDDVCITSNADGKFNKMDNAMVVEAFSAPYDLKTEPSDDADGDGDGEGVTKVCVTFR